MVNAKRRDGSIKYYRSITRERSVNEYTITGFCRSIGCALTVSFVVDGGRKTDPVGSFWVLLGSVGSFWVPWGPVGSRRFPGPRRDRPGSEWKNLESRRNGVAARFARETASGLPTKNRDARPGRSVDEGLGERNAPPGPASDDNVCL